jgi:hypothetical protein
MENLKRTVCFAGILGEKSGNPYHCELLAFNPSTKGNPMFKISLHRYFDEVDQEMLISLTPHH